jgi:hypothetical protein
MELGVAVLAPAGVGVNRLTRGCGAEGTQSAGMITGFVLPSQLAVTFVSPAPASPVTVMVSPAAGANHEEAPAVDAGEKYPA